MVWKKCSVQVWFSSAATLFGAVKSGECATEVWPERPVNVRGPEFTLGIWYLSKVLEEPLEFPQQNILCIGCL